MKAPFAWAGVIVIIFVGLALVGCSNDDDNKIVNTGSDTVAIESIYPADGSTNVSTTASIAIKFSGPVDTASVINNLFLSGGQSMQIWRDSLDHYGGFTMMNMGMESHMMSWMDSIQTPGDMHWNSTLDSCEFMPDSSLMNNTEYLCLLNESAMQGNHGSIMGGANHGDDGFHMFGFTTGP